MPGSQHGPGMLHPGLNRTRLSALAQMPAGRILCACAPHICEIAAAVTRPGQARLVHYGIFRRWAWSSSGLFGVCSHRSRKLDKLRHVAPVSREESLRQTLWMIQRTKQAAATELHLVLPTDGSHLCIRAGMSAATQDESCLNSLVDHRPDQTLAKM